MPVLGPLSMPDGAYRTVLTVQVDCNGLVTRLDSPNFPIQLLDTFYYVFYPMVLLVKPLVLADHRGLKKGQHYIYLLSIDPWRFSMVA